MIVTILLAGAIVGALALTGFCAGTETGFTSVNRGRILHMAREGSAAAKVVHSALSDMGRTIAALLVGNNLGCVVYSSASAALAARLFADSTGAQAVWSFVAAGVMLAIGEFMPKLFCATRPLRRSLRLASTFRALDILLVPFTYVALMITNIFTPHTRTKERVTPDELLRILRDRKDGVRLTDFESALIARILVLRVKGEPVTAESLLCALDGDEI